MTEEKQKLSLFKILFGGKRENALIITFGIALFIFAACIILGSYKVFEITAFVKGLMLASGLIMIAVLVIIPFLLFQHMEKK
ncbi:MAG: hypothetical protein HQK84_03305 [Nitrospinae bacterium]|nr:hypothetical protein [Nitrospinota bacterium]